MPHRDDDNRPRPRPRRHAPFGLASLRNRALLMARADAMALTEAMISLHEDGLDAARAAGLGLLDDEHRITLAASELAAMEFAGRFAEALMDLASPALGLAGAGRDLAGLVDAAVAEHFAGEGDGAGLALPTAAGLMGRAASLGPTDMT